MLVDSHCHLDFDVFQHDFASVISNALSVGVGKMLTISTKFSEFQSVLRTAAKDPAIYCSLGLHPCEVGNEIIFDNKMIESISKHPKIVGLGETGLDYYHDASHKELQKQSFVEHIRAAHNTGLPLIIHTRDAEEDTIDILKEHSKTHTFTGVMHCFTGSRWLAEEALKLGLYISFSGIVTFKNAVELQEITRIVPVDRMLVETDAPYLAPTPNRGKRNEPAFVKDTALFLADHLNIPFEEFARKTTANFHNLFTKVSN